MPARPAVSASVSSWSWRSTRSRRPSTSRQSGSCAGASWGAWGWDARRSGTTRALSAIPPAYGGVLRAPIRFATGRAAGHGAREADGNRGARDSSQTGGSGYRKRHQSDIGVVIATPKWHPCRLSAWEPVTAGRFGGFVTFEARRQGPGGGSRAG